MANPLKKLLGQTAIYGVSSILGRFLNYLLVPLYTRIFLDYEYGVVTELLAYVSFLIIFLTYGMETGLFRFSQKKRYSEEEIYSNSIGSLFTTSLIFIVIVLIFYENIALLLNYAENPEYILLLGVTVAIDAFSSIPFAQLRIQNRAKRFATLKFINIGLNIGLNLFFIVFCPKVLGENNFVFSNLYAKLDVGYIFISYFITSIVTLLLLLPEIVKVKLKFFGNRVLLKQMIKYSLPLMVAGLAGMMSETLDRILLKYLIVVPEGISQASNYVMAQVGIYGANTKIAVLMVLFIQAFRYAAEPFFFNYSKEKDSKELYARVMKYFVIFSLFVFVGITLFIDVVKIIIDQSYHEGLYIVPILLIGKIFFGIIFNLSIWYKLSNLTKYGAILAFSGAFVSISLNILLIPRYGYLGSAWASLVSYFVMMLMSFIIGRRYYRIKYDLLNILFYFILALGIYFLNTILRKYIEYYIFLNLFLVIIFLITIIRRERIDLGNFDLKSFFK